MAVSGSAETQSHSVWFENDHSGQWLASVGYSSMYKITDMISRPDRT